MLGILFEEFVVAEQSLIAVVDAAVALAVMALSGLVVAYIEYFDLTVAIADRKFGFAPVESIG